jgi:hypothetical protein
MNIKMRNKVIPTALLLALWLGAWAVPIECGAASEMFPFVISYDAPDNRTNVSAWLARPAGKEGFVHIRDGRMATAAGPIRFWGTNCCFDACFPSHEEARRVAARLARFGTNCVRMHHMDSHSIWGKSPNKTILDAGMMDRLDYFIHQLKQHGIYTNLNLHVSRTLGPAEGFPETEGRPLFDKGIGNFEPRMIALQKKYARDLLTHVNPFTHLAYREDPAVAMVEISNEDALLNCWSRGNLDDLPEPYASTFRKLWNDWLRDKHGSTDQLRQAWNGQVLPLGREMLADRSFAQPLGKTWTVQTDHQSKVETRIVPTGPEGQRALRLEIRRLGREPWIPQIWQGGLVFAKGTPYRLTGSIRSDQAQSVAVHVMQDHAPWERLGLETELQVGSAWQQFDLPFIANRDDQGGRITFSSFQPGGCELAAISLRPGGVVGLRPGQRLEDASVPAIRRDRLDLTEAARTDWLDFLWRTEDSYWTEMARFLKEDLKVRSIVSGTQAGYGPLHIQARLDYIDAHAYWHHPIFPGRAWDRKNWVVRNLALTDAEDGGTLARLASRRVAGMAYTVSEYNHPAPNQYAAEGFPMIAAFGRFQKWDGIFRFAYSHGRDYEPRRIDSFFDGKGHGPKLVHMIACAALFLRGDVEESRQTIGVAMGPAAEHARIYRDLNAWSVTTEGAGLDLRAALRHAVALDLNGAAVPVRLSKPERADQVVSDTDQLRWDFSQPKAGFFTVNTERTRLFTGSTRARTFQIGDVHLDLGQTDHDWATISLTSIDAARIGAPGHFLLAATGAHRNRGATIKELGEDRITLGDQWGEGPLLCAGISARLLLPVEAARVRFYPLDERGDRRAAIGVASQGGQALLRLDPSHKTLWYEAEILP